MVGDYHIVTANVSTGNGGYGIKITSGTKNTIVSNQLLNNTTGSISDAGTNTELGHNITA